MRALQTAYLAQLTGAARSTRAAGAHWLELFASHCEERGLALGELTPPALTAYHTRLLWQPHRGGHLYSAHSVDQALRWARAFLRWATAQGALRRDPTRQLVLTRPVTRPRPAWSPAEREAVLDRPDTSRPLGLRDRALLALCLDLGLTAQQCARLDLADYDPDSQRLVLAGGRRSPSEQILSDELAELLGRYLAEGRPALQLVSAEPALFLTRSGRRAQGLTLAATVRRYAAGASSLNRTP